MLGAASFAIAGPTIEPLHEADIQYGCGCSFHVPFAAGDKGDMVLQWEMDSPATLRVDKRVEKLKVVELRKRVLDQWPEQVGDKSMFLLTGKAVKARVENTAIEVCKPEDESCEVTYYRSRITVTTRSGTKVLNAWGNCGC